MTLEHQLVILFSKPIWHDADKEKHEFLECQQLNWGNVFSQLILHKLSSLAYHHIIQYGLTKNSIPRSIMSNLENAYKIVEMQQLLISKEVIVLCERMNEAKIRYCALKGFVLQNILYPPNTRPSSDVDFFINRDDYPKASEIAVALGFESENISPNNMTKQERLYLLLNTYEFPEFVKKIDSVFLKKILLDFQHSYSFFRQLGYTTKVENELDSTISMENEVKCQTNSDLFIHLCTHTFGDSIVISEIVDHKAFKIRSFADIYGFLDKFEVEINEVQLIQKVINTNTIMPVYFCLHYCKEIYGATEKLETLLELLRPSIDDINFVNMCGMENGMEKAMVWDCSLEEKLFDRRSVDKVKTAYAPLLERYAKYDNRFR